MRQKIYPKLSSSYPKLRDTRVAHSDVTQRNGTNTDYETTISSYSLNSMSQQSKSLEQVKRRQIEFETWVNTYTLAVTLDTTSGLIEHYSGGINELWTFVVHIVTDLVVPHN